MDEARRRFPGALFAKRRVIHAGGRRGWLCAQRGLLAGLAIFLLVSGVWALGAFRYPEWVTLDMRFVFRFVAGVDEPPAPVTIVAIDERALRTWGGWPWPRALQAELINAILSAQPAVLGIDILYTTPAADRAGDARLREALESDVPVVLAAAAGSEAELMPLADLVAPNVRLGHINSPADLDGVVRRLPVRVATSRGALNALSWEMAQAAAASTGGGSRSGSTAGEVAPGGAMPGESASSGPVAGDAASGGPPALADGTFYVNYRPRLDSPILSVDAIAETVSIVDVAQGAAMDQLRGRPVLLGVTAAGLDGLDQHLTALRPLGQIPGVYIHAAALSSILDGEYLRKQSTGSVIAALLFTSILFGAGCFWLRPWASTILALFGIAAASVLSVSFFLSANLWVEATPVLAAIVLAYAGGLWHAHAYVDQEARHVRTAFRKYVSPEVVDALLATPEVAQIGGGRREVTVLFADIRGFTTFAESMPPERVVAALNRYLALMADSVLLYGGMVDKFLGDGVMAVFGAPLPTRDHARAAVLAGIHILRQVEALRTSYQGTKLSVGIGVHTGEAVVGSVGSSSRLEYTAIGDAVNVASRLQELARPGTLVASEATMSQIPPSLPISAVAVTPVVLRGRTEPIGLYELVPAVSGIQEEREPDDTEVRQAGGEQ